MRTLNPRRDPKTKPESLKVRLQIGFGIPGPQLWISRLTADPQFDVQTATRDLPTFDSQPGHAFSTTSVFAAKSPSRCRLRVITSSTTSGLK